MPNLLYITKQPGEINFSKNPMTYTVVIVPYGILQRKQDFRIRIGVEVEKEYGSGIFAEVKSQIIYPDNGGKVEIDISSIADAYLHFYTPRPGLIVPTQVKQQSGRFRINVIVQKDGQLYANLASDACIAIKGGLAYEQENVAKFFTDYIATQHKPLHFFADKEMVLDEKRFLTWLYSAVANEDQILKWKLYFDDGTNATASAADGLPAQLWGMYIAPIGYAQLQQALPIAVGIKTPVYFTVEVNTASYAVVAPIAFYLEQRSFYNSKTLLYTNSIGGKETMRILGEIDASADYTATNAERITPPGNISNALLVAQNVATQNVELEKFSGNTNFISLQKLDRLRDLLLSTIVYEIKNDRLIPAIINKKTVKFYSNKDSLYGMAIEWQNAYNNTMYTPQGLLNSASSCPALESFIISQSAKNKLQIIWAMPIPYDLLQVTIDNGTPAQLLTIYLAGNTGSEEITFTNPAVYPGTAAITVTGNVVCDQDSEPIDKGADSVVHINVIADTPPIASDDLYSIAAGYTTPQVLAGSVLDNDFDADGDALEVIVAAGATAAGGTYSINAAGIVTYTPPAANYNGTDSFTYTMREVVNTALTSTATVRINVGNITFGDGVYVKIVERNHYDNKTQNSELAGGDYYVQYFTDPLCTIPKNVSGLGLVINMNRTVTQVNNGVTTITENIDSTIAAGGFENLYYSGDTYVYISVLGATATATRKLTVKAGTGYIPV
jgi:hypothetical protein